MGKRKPNGQQFEDRVRFNWGYHDGAFAVKHGLDDADHNFGFATGGSLYPLRSEKDVLEKHFDNVYARGWQEGLADARDGTYEAVGQKSEVAWNRTYGTRDGTVYVCRKEKDYAEQN